MDLTMDYFEGLDELFRKDVTEDYLAESFNTGPIKFENIFDENQTDQFDSIVPEDISCFLDTELNECAGEGLNIDLEHVLDNNNNASQIDPIDCMFDFDDLDLEVGDACDIKQELKEFPEIKSDMDSPQTFLKLPCTSKQEPFADTSHLFTIDHTFKTVKQEKVNETLYKHGNSEKSIGQNHKDVKNVKRIKLEDAIKSSMQKSPIIPKVEVMDKSSRRKYPIIPDIKDEEKSTKTKNTHTKDMKAFQFCDLCPFKTKEKSIFRMHTSLVHKLDASKCTKKAPQKSETTGKSFKAAPPQKPKINGATHRETVSSTADELEKKVASRKFTNASLEGTFVPTFSITHNGHPIDLNGTTELNSVCYNKAQDNPTPVNTRQHNPTPVSLSEFLSSTDIIDPVDPVKVNQLNHRGFLPCTDSAAPVTTNQASYDGFIPIIDSIASIKTYQENFHDFLTNTESNEKPNQVNGFLPCTDSEARETDSHNGFLHYNDSEPRERDSHNGLLHCTNSEPQETDSHNGFLHGNDSDPQETDSNNGFLPIIDSVVSLKNRKIHFNRFLPNTESYECVDPVKSNQVNQNGFHCAAPLTPAQVSFNGFLPIIDSADSSIRNQVNHNGFVPNTKSFVTVDPEKVNQMRFLSSNNSVDPLKSNQASFNGFLPSSDRVSLMKTNRVSYNGFPSSTVTVTPVKPNPVTYTGFPTSTVTVTPVKSNPVTYNGFPPSTVTVTPLKTNQVSYTEFPTSTVTVTPVKSNPVSYTGFPRKTVTVTPTNAGKVSYSAFPGNVGIVSTSSGVGSASGNCLPSVARLPNISTTMGNHFLSINPGIVSVASCRIINPAPKKFVSILPKGPDCLNNRFQQPSGKSSYRSNERLVRNSQERQRRSETKKALDAVKSLVPRLKFAEKPSQIKVLNETIEYVKHLRKEEQDDIEELEEQRRAFMMLESKYRILCSRR